MTMRSCGGLSSWRVWVFLGALFVVLGPRGVECVQCAATCDPFQCDSPDCEGKTIPDRCNCCFECAKQVNETCGGQFGVEGTCDDDLVCTITPPIGSTITDTAVGVCKEIPGSAEPASCNDVVCDSPSAVVCPADSVAVSSGNSRSRKCCQPEESCACKSCPAVDRTCSAGFVRVLKSEGLRQPGNCCDIYECIEHAKFCDQVPCDAYLFNTSCPDDSVPLTTSPTFSENSCCPSVENRCRCKPKTECRSLDCPPNLQKRVRSVATGSPGSCCDQFDCINGSNPVCLHNGLSRLDGDRWKLDECTNCRCQKGLTFCEPVQCPVLPRCSWIGRPEGQCCSVCKGCVAQNGELHLSGATWQQDSCVTCHCEEGQVYCQAQLCHITCANPRTIPGQCCPECDEDGSRVIFDDHCPSLSNCTLMCQKGYSKGPDGCYKCQCNETAKEPCPLECRHGYRIDVSGVELCECADQPITRSPLIPSTTDQPSSSSSALLTVRPTCEPMMNCMKQCSYGYRKDKTGCPRCRCNHCPLMENCTKKCATGFVYNADGCRLCKCLDADVIETVTPRPPVDTWRCISVNGERLEEGQVWWDGCRKCFCHQGQEMCALVTCPALRCANPVIRPGSCCPSCGGDVAPPMSSGTNMCHSSDGRYFVEGEMWQLDDCTQCICHQGSALCTIASCPPTLCHQPVIMPQSCCPVCPDKNGFLPSIPWKKTHLRSCRSITGTHYSSGDTWQVNACQSCTCHDGQVHCFSQTCPILRCNKTILKKNQCCPMCMDNSAKYCTYGENIYSADETWLVDDCTRCICSAEGQVLCMVTVCEPPKCDKPIASSGSCCPVCPNATLARDGHLSGTNITAKEYDPGSKTSLILIAVVACLAFIIFVLAMVIIFLYRRRKKDAVVFNNKSQPVAVSQYPYIPGSNCHLKPTNLDYKIQNQTPLSSVTASSKLSSSEHSLKMQQSMLSCSEAKPSDSDESLLDNNSYRGHGERESFDDTIKLAEPCVSPSTPDLEVSTHFSAMDHLRIKHLNRHSTGDELEQTRHLLSATPSLGVTNNNRKSW